MAMGFIDGRSRSSSSSMPSRCSGCVLPPKGTATFSRLTLAPAPLETLDPLPLWYEPYEQRIDRAGKFPLFAVTQRPMAMYHSWGSQNAWLRQIHGWNRLYVNRAHGRAPGARRRRLGLDREPLGPREGAIEADGRRRTNHSLDLERRRQARGRLESDPNAPEAMRGFLLNHVISELLPGTDAQPAMANADPITGQAAWYDLRVRLAKVAQEETGVTEPLLSPLTPMLPKPPKLAHGEWFRAAGARENDRDQPAATITKEAWAGHRPRHLRRLSSLRGRLQGMERRRGFRSPARPRSLRPGAAWRVVQSRAWL